MATEGWKATAYAGIAVAALACAGAAIGALGHKDAGGATKVGIEPGAPAGGEVRGRPETSLKMTRDSRKAIT